MISQGGGGSLNALITAAQDATEPDALSRGFALLPLQSL